MRTPSRHIISSRELVMADPLDAKKLATWHLRRKTGHCMEVCLPIERMILTERVMRCPPTLDCRRTEIISFDTMGYNLVSSTSPLDGTACFACLTPEASLETDAGIMVPGDCNDLPSLVLKSKNGSYHLVTKLYT